MNEGQTGAGQSECRIYSLPPPPPSLHTGTYQPAVYAGKMRVKAVPGRQPLTGQQKSGERTGQPATSQLKDGANPGAFSLKGQPGHPGNHLNLETGWGGRIRTYGARYQKPVPYHLATPQLCGRM